MPARGRLIALEGIDGCGKSTQAAALADVLGARLTHEPGATPVGARLRELLLAPDAPAPSPRAEALLMAADRAEHVALVIEPALAAGEWVVSDRYAGVDHRLPGLRAGPRPRRAGGLIALGHRRGGRRPLDPGRRAASRWPRPGWPPHGRRGSRPDGAPGSGLRGAGARGVPGPGGGGPGRAGSSSTGRVEVGALTAHIVASVRERLGDAPAAGR